MLRLSPPHHFLPSFLALFFIFVKPVVASDFQTSLHTTYTLDQEGVTTVTHALALTNHFADRFAQEYSLTVDSDRLKNITVYDQKGISLTPKIDSQNARTKITVFFPSPVVGKGKTNQFSISYLDPDIAQNQGSVLQLAIPRLENATSFDQYQVTLLTPLQFGPPHALYPKSYQLTQDPAFTKIVFSASDLKNQGISAIFGDRQIYNFNLSFNLENTNVTPLETQVAIPPDTLYQQVYYQAITPEPKMVNLDSDGNWIATFYLEPKQKQKVVLNGQFITYLKPTLPVIQAPIQNYLSAEKNWPIQAEFLKTFSSDNSKPASLYYQVLAKYTPKLSPNSTETINPNRVSITKLNDRTELNATEYVDLLISLFRSHQIPARALIGYPVTDSPQKPSTFHGGMLHIWMEYYDQASLLWKPIDPYWEETTGGVDHFNTFDFNHLVFAIQGTDSDQPLPLGLNLGYQLTPTDLDLVVSQAIPQNQLKLSANVEETWLNQLNLNNRYHAIITNQSGYTLYPSPYRLSLSQPPDQSIADGQFNSPLLPYQKTTIPLDFQSFKIPYGQTLLTHFTYQNETIDLQILIPPSTQILSLIAFSLILVTIIAIITLKTRGLLVPRRQR